MSRRKRYLDNREKQFVEGVTSGKSLAQSARDAGYSRSTAAKKSYAIAQRPLIESALTEALLNQGITLEKIVKPIVDGLEATVRIVRKNGTVIVTDLPDHRVRGENADRAIALLGGVARAQEKPLPPAPSLIVNISEFPSTQRAGPDGYEPQGGNEPIQLNVKLRKD